MSRTPLTRTSETATSTSGFAPVTVSVAPGSTETRVPEITHSVAPPAVCATITVQPVSLEIWVSVVNVTAAVGAGTQIGPPVKNPSPRQIGPASRDEAAI